MGYLGIVFLMTIESSFIPFPSEIIIPPAAYLASQGEMNIYLVVLSGVIGSLVGATVNYVLALTLGRKLIFSLTKTRIAKLLLISEKKVHTAEQYFLKYGNVSTFFCRLLPAVRQLISLPAGFSKMNFVNFLFFTFLGSFIWTAILAALGYGFGANQELLARHYHTITIFFVFAFLIITSFLVVRIKKQKRDREE